jgi:hypothetical protein
MLPSQGLLEPSAFPAGQRLAMLSKMRLVQQRVPWRVKPSGLLVVRLLRAPSTQRFPVSQVPLQMVPEQSVALFREALNNCKI